MKDFGPQQPSALPPLPGKEVAVSGAVQAAGQLAQAAGGVSPYEPSDHKFDFRLGDGKRLTLPEHLFEGQGIPDGDRTIELRQITIAENCRCIRLATRGDEVNDVVSQMQAARSCIRKIGVMEGADLGDKELDRWFDAIGQRGFEYMKALLVTLNGPTQSGTEAYEASRVVDIERRRYSYKIPISLLPAKRWGARAGLADVKRVDEKATVKKGNKEVVQVVGSRWTVKGAAPSEADSILLNRDLSFTMQVLTVDQSNKVADLVDDPDDRYASRIMEVMLSIVEIGGSVVGNSSEDLARKLAWLEDIGPRVRLLVVGTYVRLHEVDWVDLARFLDSAEALD